MLIRDTSYEDKEKKQNIQNCIKGLLINNDIRFVENNISQLTQNFRLANKIKVLPVFERYQLPIKELYLCRQECYAYLTLKNK